MVEIFVLCSRRWISSESGVGVCGWILYAGKEEYCGGRTAEYELLDALLRSSCLDEVQYRFCRCIHKYGR